MQKYALRKKVAENILRDVIKKRGKPASPVSDMESYADKKQ
jgi:hypothetical protein